MKPESTHFIESETRRLKAYFKENPQELIGCSVIFGGNQAVVRFFGKLQEGDKHGEDLWVGVRWDDVTRGKHNGTVNGYKYFECEEGAGSMLRFEKIEFGYKVQTGFFKRYFRNEQLYMAKTLYNQLGQIKRTSKTQVQKKQARDQLGRRKVHIQFDSQAYVQTLKKNKVMVEFVGFDQIWNKIHNLDEIVNINLPQVQICDLEGEGVLRNMFPKVQIFSLEKNLLHDWHQAYLVGHQLQNLQQFTLTKNKLKQPEDVLTLDHIKLMYTDKIIKVSPVNIFKNLKSMVLIDTDLNWKKLFKVYPSFPSVQELVLCRNKMFDYENVIFDENHAFKELKFMNLQETEMNDEHFEGLKKFKDLPLLDKLILNRNKLKRFGIIEGFKSLKCLSLESNLIDVPIAISQLSKLDTLQYFNIKHNPIGDMLGQAYVRQRSVSELPKLKWINNSDLKKYERKDYQIYYMREVFHEYFNLRKVPDYDYDYKDFQKWTETSHPNINRLIKIYGIPYQPQKKQIVEIIKSEQMPTAIKKPGGTCDVKVQMRSGPLAGTTQIKKVLLSWTLANVKNLFSKTMKIPVKNQKISFKVRQTSEQQPLQDEHKTLAFFNITQQSILFMDFIA